MLAVTQFDAGYARRGFPCFDVRSFKTVFKITLGHKNDLKSDSNTRLLKTTPMLVQFNISPNSFDVILQLCKHT